MVEPTIIPRAEHTVSRRDIDPDALKVLYRLRQFDYVAYLVGGSVRDLLLGRRPKDFDIGTSAHPYQVKRLFRNCWIVGRRFRLAHVKFGTKTIEVATFRRQVPPETESEPAGDQPAAIWATDAAQAQDRLIHRDNTFGTPEEDAFRRDFTINALFYDVATFSIIDYVGGLEDLRAGLVRSIGNPDERFREDPVRMLRAIALSSRLDFIVDPPILDAIGRQRTEIARAAPARLLEEYYKILRTGASEAAFRALLAAGLLEPTAPELHKRASDALWQSLQALDAYRRRFDETPETLTNTILLGSLLVPLGFKPFVARPLSEDGARSAPGGGRPTLGALPLAKRDLERLGQILSIQRRLRDSSASQRATRGLMHRSSFLDALTWMEIHGDSPEVVERWRAMTVDAEARPGEQEVVQRRPGRRRRRRGRRRPPAAES